MGLLSNKSSSKKRNEEKNKEGKEKAKPNKKNLSSYQDPITGTSLKKLKTGLWFIEHVSVFKKTLWILLILIVVGLWIYVISGFGWYIFKGMERDEKMINEMTTGEVTTQQKSSNQLEFSRINSISHGGKYDLYTKVKNPQEHYTATFDHCFTQNDKEISCEKGFIYPEQTKYVFSLSQELNNRSNIGFKIKNVNWDRIDYHEIRDWDQYKNEHLNFQFQDVQYSSSAQNEYSDQLDLNALDFKVINNTPYSYWDAELNIILYNMGKVVGMNTYTINKFHSGKKKEIELIWSANVDRVTDVSITPNINIMDEDNYIRPSE